MGIPLRRGRLLDEHDMAGAPPSVLISESLAKREFPGEDPIGQRVHVGPLTGPWYTVVGIVGDVKQTSLAEDQPDAVYITPAQSWFADDAMSLVVRARGDAAALAPTVKKAIWSVDKDQPIVRVATMDRPAGHVGGPAALRHDPVRGICSCGAGARGDRHLWRLVRQRHRANARDRRAGGAGCVTQGHPHAGGSPGDGAHWAWRPDRVGVERWLRATPSSRCCSAFHSSTQSHISV